MKLQHLAIIFVIIMLPITLVISSYIQTQIDTISLQTKYSTKLQTATYDAIKAFQLNTLNNKYSTNSDSKIRDIEASINTFYNSLGTELGASGYDKESLQQFIPAIVYTMYDGYYIYGKYYNSNINDYQYGLKPYIYYSCRYKGNNYDVVINYTLDNSITVYGKVNGEYVTKSGTLINPNLVKFLDEKLVEYGTSDNKVEIEPEILKEQIVILNNSMIGEREEREYTVYNNQKIYYEPGSRQETDYFRYVSNKKQFITNSDSNRDEISFLKKWTYDGHLHCNSAIEYYKNAKDFSEWVTTNLGNISQKNAVDANENPINDFAIDTGNSSIFKLDDKNDPMLDSSIFNQNRISVIRRTIQSTLNTAIANFSSNAAYEFVMPVFQEEDWDKLENNISVATFMQGIPIGAKYFNNYCIIANNKNKEIVSKDSICLITGDTDDNNVVHLASSKHLVDEGVNIKTACNNINLEPQTVQGNETYTYFPQYTSERCYKCMVSMAETYNIDDIIAGEVKVYDRNQDAFVKDITLSNKIKSSGLRQVYLTALARERYNLYKTNDYFGI